MLEGRAHDQGHVLAFFNKILGRLYVSHSQVIHRLPGAPVYIITV